MPIYVKNTWTDRNVSTPIDYTATKGGGGALSSGDTLSMTASPGVVTEAGTAITASYMNNIEVGLEDTNNGRWIEIDGDTTISNATTTSIPINILYDEYKITSSIDPNTAVVGNQLYFRVNGDNTALYDHVRVIDNVNQNAQTEYDITDPSEFYTVFSDYFFELVIKTPSSVRPLFYTADRFFPKFSGGV